ncbi:MAG: HAMP domain-containing protein [Geobacter sp.]|nr:MAG: HAMP domain-containing protein [Geobacter sp.]
MKFGVRHKLFLAILTAAALAVVCSALIMQWSLKRGFLRFVNSMEQTGVARFAAKLEEGYRSEQTWDFLKSNPARWQQLLAVSLLEVPPPPGEPGPAGFAGAEKPRPLPPEPPEADPRQQLPPHVLHQINQRLLLLDAERKVVISPVTVTAGISTTPLTFQGKVVGYLGFLPLTNLSEPPQKRFLAEQKQALALQAVFIVILAAALSMFMARRLVCPLNELAQATHQLAAGRFSVRVPVASRDELGQLADDFNSLAETLANNEQSRRLWVADISHELRTPLAILRGETEALQDGIRLPTSETINSLHAEVLHLNRLVDDLYQLSLSDVGALTYRKTRLDLVEVLMEVMVVYYPKFLAKGIAVRTDIVAGTAVIVFGDKERLHQLFSNLFDNTLKYTDSGGDVQVALQQDGSRIVVLLKDSAPGVSTAELGRLFDRLYRVESSRNRLSGGAGLGLAICRTIVEAHGGSITAQPSSLGGVLIRIELPQVGN